MIVSTRSRGFVYHAYPDDFWRFEPADMERIFSDMRIEAIERDSMYPGVFVKVRKPRGFQETDPLPLALYSIMTGTRRRTLSDFDIGLFRLRCRLGREVAKYCPLRQKNCSSDFAAACDERGGRAHGNPRDSGAARGRYRGADPDPGSGAARCRVGRHGLLLSRGGSRDRRGFRGGRGTGDPARTLARSRPVGCRRVVAEGLSRTAPRRGPCAVSRAGVHGGARRARRRGPERFCHRASARRRVWTPGAPVAAALVAPVHGIFRRLEGRGALLVRRRGFFRPGPPGHRPASRHDLQRGGHRWNQRSGTRRGPCRAPD